MARASTPLGGDSGDGRVNPANSLMAPANVPARQQTFSLPDQDDALARAIIRENTGGKDPELSLAEDFLSELEPRLEQAKIYLPILELLRKRKAEDEFLRLIPELCFLVLSYLIYEGKLKYRGVSFSDLQSFLSDALVHIWPGTLASDKTPKLTPEKTAKLAVDIMDGLQNGGKNFTLKTMDFNNQQLREKYIKFIEIKQTDDGVLQYYITEQGVDFYLKTKEFPEETKITINLLLFQKQMEKGAFGFAYETVRRLNMEVQKKKDRKYTLLEALLYGRSDGGETYRGYHRGIVLQFEEETELFQTAVLNVRQAFDEYMDRINKGEATEKERRTFTLIKIIEKEISRAQTLHTELLKEAVGFTGEYDQVLKAKRKALFTERFNFERELEKLTQEGERPDALKFLFEPLLRPYVRKNFNPLRILEPRRVVKTSHEEPETEGDDDVVARVTLDHLVGNRVRRNFIFYAAHLLQMMETPDRRPAFNEAGPPGQAGTSSPGQSGVSSLGQADTGPPGQAGTVPRRLRLADFCCDLKDKYGEDALYNGDFISFLLELNRGKNEGQRQKTIRFGDQQIHANEELKTMEEIFLKASLETFGEVRTNQIAIVSFPDHDIEFLPGLKITDMLLKGERV